MRTLSGLLLPLISVAGVRRGRFQELVSSTLQPDLTPDGVEPVKREEVKENPLLSWSEPVDVITAFGAGQEVGYPCLERRSSS